MAIAYVGAGALAVNATVATQAIAQPTCAIGDVLIAVVVNKALANAMQPPAAAGWTEIYQAQGDCTTAADDHRVGIWWKLATATTGNHTFTKTTDDNLVFGGVISAWSGVRGTVPLDATAVASQVNVGAADNVTFPAFDPTSTNSEILFVAIYGNDLTTFGAAMSSDSNPDCTKRLDLETSAGTDFSIAITSGPTTDGANIASRTWASASTTDAGSSAIVFGLVPADATATLTDNFDDGTIDTAKFTETDPDANVNETGGQLQISTTTGAAYRFITSKERYYLTGSSMLSRLMDAGNQALTSLESYPVYLANLAATQKLFILVTNGYIYCFRTATQIGAEIAYDSAVHKYFRIREASGTTYYDYSTNGSSWTNITSEANAITLTYLYQTLMVGTYAAEGSATTAKIDNLNLVPSVAVTGTATASIGEADIVAGGKTIILTLTNDTWAASGATFDAQRQNIINGLDSAQSEGTGWDAVVKAAEAVTAVVRTSDTVCTITLSARASYDITANETITCTVPATATAQLTEMVGAPTFTVSAVGGSVMRDIISMGMIAFPR